MIALSEAVRSARLQQIIDALDAGSAAGKMKFYSGTRPSAGGAPTGVLQATITLAKPCGEVEAAILTFVTGVEGQRVAEDEIAWVRLTDSDDTFVADLSVSGVGGTGDVIITNVNGYIGAFVRLQSLTIGE